MFDDFQGSKDPENRVLELEIENPRGSIYTTIMELGPQSHSKDGLLGLNSIIVVHVDPLGIRREGVLRFRV